MKRVVMISLLCHALAAATLFALSFAPPAEPVEPARIELLFGDNGVRPTPPAAVATPAAPSPVAPQSQPSPPIAADAAQPAAGPVTQTASSDPGVRVEERDSSMIPARDDPGNSAPPYPEDAWQRHEQGTVLLRLHIGADGTVTRLDKLQSSGSATLDAAAETALSHWHFVPAERDGHKVASYRDQPIRFVLE